MLSRGSLYKPLLSAHILEIYSCVLGKQTLLYIRKGIFHIKNKGLCSIKMGEKVLPEQVSAVAGRMSGAYIIAHIH